MACGASVRTTGSLGPHAGGASWASSSTTGARVGGLGGGGGRTAGGPMASPGTNFESIEALWAKGLGLDLETDPVDLDASPSAALAAFTCLACFLSSSDRGGPLPRPLFWPSPPIASATLIDLEKGCHTQKSSYTVGFGLGFGFAFGLGRDWLDREPSSLWGPTESSSKLWLG